MITIKIKLNNRVRSLAIEGSISYKTLKRFCIDMFDTLKGEQSFIITYVDDEGDIISIGSDVELMESFRVMSKHQAMTYTVVKIEEDVHSEEESCESSESEASTTESDDNTSDDSYDSTTESVDSSVSPAPAPEEKVYSMEDVRKLEASLNQIEDALNQKPKVVNEKTSEFRTKIAEFFNSLKEKLQQFSLELDERFVIPISRSLEYSFEEISVEVKKLKEELKKMKEQMEVGFMDAMTTLKKDFSSEKTKESVKEENKESVKEGTGKEDTVKEQDDIDCSEAKRDLKMLEEMGFKDKRKNLELLAKYPNELGKVIEELLK